jgi:Ca-activated chloride channel family protein
MFYPVRSVSCLALLLFLLTFRTTSYSQTSLNEVHVAPRRVEVASVLPGRALIRSSAHLVLVPVTITDGLDRPVLGLDQNNFQLYENKKPQAIKHFSSEDTPVSIGLIVDMSGSMANKMERTREAIHDFCEASNPQDEFLMVTFSDGPSLATDFTNNGAELENSLLTSQSKGRTALLDAIYMGLRKMKDARYPRRALLILSDGGDNHSRYSERDVRNAVKEADVLLYAVGTYDQYVNTQEELLGPELLRSITETTGGKAYTVTDVRVLPAVTKAIGTQLRHQYVLAYQPQSSPHNGKWYKINVKLRLPKSLHAFLHVTARPGYYASSE